MVGFRPSGKDPVKLTVQVYSPSLSLAQVSYTTVCSLDSSHHSIHYVFVGWIFFLSYSEWVQFRRLPCLLMVALCHVSTQDSSKKCILQMDLENETLQHTVVIRENHPDCSQTLLQVSQQVCPCFYVRVFTSYARICKFMVKCLLSLSLSYTHTDTLVLT